MEKFNARYIVAADKKEKEKIFEERDMIMVYLRKEKIHVGSYNK